MSTNLGKYLKRLVVCLCFLSTPLFAPDGFQVRQDTRRETHFFDLEGPVDKFIIDNLKGSVAIQGVPGKRASITVNRVHLAEYKDSPLDVQFDRSSNQVAVNVKYKQVTRIFPQSLSELQALIEAEKGRERNLFILPWLQDTHPDKPRTDPGDYLPLIVLGEHRIPPERWLKQGLGTTGFEGSVGRIRVMVKIPEEFVKDVIIKTHIGKLTIHSLWGNGSDYEKREVLFQSKYGKVEIKGGFKGVLITSNNNLVIDSRKDCPASIAEAGGYRYPPKTAPPSSF